MVYKSFLSAARKHVATCEALLLHAKNLNPQRPNNQQEQQHILLNLYYLTGYIFECSIKYAIYKSINYDPQTSVTQLDQADLTYNKHIKHHRLVDQADCLSKLYNGIKLVDDLSGVPMEIRTLYREWKVERRYETMKEIDPRLGKTITINNLNELLKYAIELFKTVQRM